IAAYILGALRAEPLSGHAQGRLMRLDIGFAGSCTPHGQMVYFRSWIQTTCRGKASREDLEALATRVASASPQAQETAFWVFSRFPLIPNVRPELFAFALDWLARNASPRISAPAKYHTVQLAALLAATDRHDSGSLILSVQPIPPEEK